MLPLYRFLSAFVLFLFLGINSQAQTCLPAPVGGDDCFTAPLMSCNLDGYMGSSGGYTPGPAPDGFCGLVENDQYFRFIADETLVAITIVPSNCTTAKGLQAALYETSDCLALNPVSLCASFGSVASLNVLNGASVIGQEYYLLIDGFEGDVCDFTINVVQGILPDVEAEAEDAELCLGNEIQLDGTASTQRMDVEYIWSTGNGNIISGENTLTPTVDALGDYTLRVVDIVSCCIDEVTIEVTENMTSPSFGFQFTNVITCTDLNVTLDPNLPNPTDYDFLWSTISGSISASTPSTGATILVETAGTYTLDLLDVNTGCTYSQDVIVTLDNTAPDVFASSTNNLDCFNSNSNISANSVTTGLMYSWTGPNMFISSDATFSASEAGTYAVTITATNGCTAIADVEVTSSGNPNADILKERDLNCLVADTKLTGMSTTANVSYVWTGPSGPAGNTAEITVAEAGTYTLSVSTPNGCSTTITQLVEEDKGLPNISATVSNDIDCTVLDATLEGASTSVGATYSWTGPNLFTSTAAQPVVNEGGPYDLTVTGTNGCTDMISVTVIQNAAAPIADAGTSVMLDCNIATAVIGGPTTSTGLEFSYEWTSTIGIGVLGTEATLTAEAAGDYTLKVTNTNNNCSSTSTISVLSDFIQPTVDAGADAFLTCSMRTVTLGGTSSIGTEFTYSWFDDAGNILSNDASYTTTILGAYTLEITNTTNGCKNSDVVIVDEDPYNPIAAVVNPENITCDNPIITLSSVGSTAGVGITYEWFDNNNALISTDATVEVSNPGAYQLVVTDNNFACSDAILIRVDESVTPPLGSAGVDRNLDCASVEAVLEASVSGDINDFDFEWFDDQGNSLAMTFDLTTSTAGQYDLIITDKVNRCTRESFATVFDNNVYPDADAGAEAIITCAVQQVQIGGANSSLGNDVIHAWFDASGDLVGNTPIIDVDAPGDYQLVVTNASSSCSTESFVTVMIDQNEPIANAGTAAMLTCNDPTSMLDADQSTATNGLLTYEWLDPNGLTISTTALANATLTGDYQLIVTDVQNGCANSTTIFVDEDKVMPVVSVTNPEIINCFNNFVEINYASENGPITPVWQDVNGNILSTEENFLATEIGTVVLEATSQSNGCVSTAAIDIIEDKVAPEASIATPEVLTCLIADAQLIPTISNFSTAATYEWTNNTGDILDQTADLSVSDPGTYTLEITNVENGCTALFFADVMQNVIIPTAVISNTENRIDCFQPAIDIDATLSTGNAVLTYEWTNSDQEIISTDEMFSLTQGGDINLLVTNTVNSCIHEAMVNIDEDLQNPEINFTPVDKLTCTENSVDIESVVTGSNFSFAYTWTGPDSTSVLSDDDIAIVTVDGVGNYTVLVQDQLNGCEATAIINVEEDRILPETVILPARELNCITETVTIDASGSSAGSEFTYSWTGGNILSGGETSIIEVDSAAQYQLTIVNTETGCINDMAIQVSENSARPVGATLIMEDPTCFGERDGVLDVANVNGGTAPYLYAVNSETNFTDINTYNNLPAGDYSLIVQDGIGCEWDTLFQIIDPDQVTANLGADQIIRLGETSDLFVQTTGDIISIDWTDNGEQGPIDVDFRDIQPIKTTTYIVVVTNNEGCSGTDNVVVEVEDDRRVYIPNAFSPNGDGANDFFTLYTDIAAFEVSSLQIFDKWGSQVFEKNNFSPNIPEIGWNGNWRGEKMQPGTYVYSAFIEFRNGKKINFKGEINIVY